MGIEPKRFHWYLLTTYVTNKTPHQQNGTHEMISPHQNNNMSHTRKKTQKVNCWFKIISLTNLIKTMLICLVFTLCFYYFVKVLSSTVLYRSEAQYYSIYVIGLVDKSTQKQTICCNWNAQLGKKGVSCIASACISECLTFGHIHADVNKSWSDLKYKEVCEWQE